MASTTGRNDPCPCGSGKKYKHCCLNKQDNVLPFPGTGGLDEKLREYQKLVENWDHADGPVPSFMEFQGSPNLATKSIHDLNQKIGDRVFQSKKELQDFMNQHMLSSNSAPLKEFLGMSPSQMYSVLHKSFFDNTALIELNERISHELLAGAPVLKQCCFLLQSLSESEKGIKATQLGNFPRKLTQEFYDKFIKEHDIFKDTPMKEDDVPELQEIRFFLTDSGLMKKQHGQLSLTQKGKKFLHDDNPFEQYKLLFQFFGVTFNWLYRTRYPDPFEFIQNSLIFCLYILKHKAGGFINGDKLADVFKNAFPEFVKDMSSFDRYNMVSSGFCYLFLDKFARHFGLVEKKGDKRTYLSSEDQYRRTELFEGVFVWRV
jgi:hypothetical protein